MRELRQPAFVAAATLLLASGLGIGLSSLTAPSGNSRLRGGGLHRTSPIVSFGTIQRPTTVTAAEIRQALHDAAARLVDLELAIAEVNDRSSVVLKQFWLHRDSAQLLYDQKDNVRREDWWNAVRPVNGPLAAIHLLSIRGLKICVDVTRPDVVWADSRGGEIPGKATLHYLKQSLDWMGDLFLPLVELDKPWVLPERRSAAPVINTLARQPLANWHVLGEESMDGSDCVKAEIDECEPVAIKLQRHPGELTLRQTHVAWFSRQHGWMPVRIEKTMRYEVAGHQFELARREDGRAPLVYEASDFVQVRGVWFPRRGRQDQYNSAEPGSAPGGPPDFDSLVDTLLRDGEFRLNGEMNLVSHKEWRVLRIKPIDPSLNLWFDPPPGAEVVIAETGKRFVAGDPAASAKMAAREAAIEARIGQRAPEFPYGATWLNGEPLTWQALRGRVVLLDFWADWCGACRNDLPALGELHHDRSTNGMAIIGIHPPGSEPASIHRMLKDYQLHYPICIDVPHKNSDAADSASYWGDFFAHFAIDRIPHFVVVDANGIVVASETNDFTKALAAAKRLTADANPASAN
jgi:thiol-disulfide isomerase/thioredoxin